MDSTKTPVINKIMNLIDNSKEDMKENDYLEMCNFMKKCYIQNNKPVINSFVSTNSSVSINSLQNTINIKRNYINSLNLDLLNLKLPSGNTCKRKYPVLIKLCKDNNLYDNLPIEHKTVRSVHKYNIDFLENLLKQNNIDITTINKKYYDFRCEELQKNKEYFLNRIRVLENEIINLQNNN